MAKDTQRLAPLLEQHDRFSVVCFCLLVVALSLGEPSQVTVLGGNAPRVLRDVVGDFEAQVTVLPFAGPPSGASTGPNQQYVGAGLVVWQVNPMLKVFRDEPPGPEVRSLAVRLARNELIRTESGAVAAPGVPRLESLPRIVASRSGRIRLPASTRPRG